MLIFSAKLHRYIVQKIIPNLIADPSNYCFKGAYHRKEPYVLQIDLINQITYGPEELRNKLLELLQNQRNIKSIIATEIICGTDERFKDPDNFDPRLTKDTQPLLPPNILFEFNQLKTPSDKEKFIQKFYQLAWNTESICRNELILYSSSTKVKLTDLITAQEPILLKSYLIIDGEPVVARILVTHDNPKLVTCFDSDNNIDRTNQLLTKIDIYHDLLKLGKLDIRTATFIVISIVRDCAIINSDLVAKLVNQIKRVALNNPPDIKIREWDILLDKLALCS